ncbi:hypothetical protein M3Y97_00355400 [Aphelenchoides bicaudatus]|nr:hypothetical protein M3Y97_00355400 [Aphelenchoides bicaudatus]
MTEPSTSHDPVVRTKRRRAPKKTNARQTEQLMLSALIHDVDGLLKKFNETGGNSFYEFGQCFIDLEFPTIFLGRYSTSELVEFSEFLLSYSASFMFSGREPNQVPSFLINIKPDDMKKLTVMKKERTLKERIFGVFLTYCLYFTQPQTNIANIKLSSQEMKELLIFCQKELLSSQSNEALFCINRLVDQHAFMVIAFEKEFNPLLARRFNVADMVMDTLDISESSSNEPFPALRNIQKDFTLTQTDLVHQRYIAEKNKHKLPSSMYSVTDDLLSKISNIVAKTEKELEDLQ